MPRFGRKHQAVISSKLIAVPDQKREESRRKLRRALAAVTTEALESRRLLTGSNLTIVPTYDSTITTLTNASAVEATIQAAITQIESLVTTNTPVSVTIDFQNQNSGLGASQTPQIDIPYSTYLADLKANPNKSANDTQALSTMPTGPNTGINNATMVLETAANLQAIGDPTDAAAALATGDGYYGDVYLNIGIMNVTRPGTNANNYDLESTALHEIDEVLGIGGNATTLYQPNNNIPSLPSDVSGLDFFRYSSQGVRSFTYDDTATAYFSIDAGKTPIVYFNQDNGAGGADFGDWDDPQNDGQGNSPPQVQDAFGGAGDTAATEPNLGTSELTALDVVGYNLIPQAGAPSITTNPTSQTVVSNSTVTFTAAATGTPAPSVQWQVSVGGGAFANINGATSTTLSLIAATGENGNQYQAVFTNSAGSATTTAATLTVTPATAPTVTSSPTSQSVLSGATVTFTAGATGTPAPTVQWRVSVGGGAFTNVSGATSTTLSFIASAGQTGNQYEAVFTNSAGSKTTTAATLTVTALVAPAITLNPVSQSVDAGASVTFTAAATGTPAPTVQWQVSVGGGAFTNISGATSTTLSLVASTGLNGNQYKAVFTNSTGSAPTAAATLTVVPLAAPVVTTNPLSQSINSGSTVTFTAAASGVPAPTVQWQVSVGGGAFTNINGATSTTLSFVTNTGQTGNQYQAVFTNSSGTATTTAATLTVGTFVTPVITLNPVSLSATNGMMVSFTAAATGTPTPTVQWQQSAGGGAFADIAGATSPTLSFPALTNESGYQVRAVFTNGAGTATTTAATLTVTTAAAPVVTTSPTSQSLNSGQTATFTAAASGTPTPTVQWQVSVSGGAFTNINGATSPTLSFVTTASESGDQYQAVFTNSSGSATTTAATLTVTQTVAPVVTTSPVTQSLTAGATVTFTAAATGTPSPTVQWQVSVSGGAFTNINGATSTTLSFVTQVSQSGNQYQAVFTNSAGSATTSAATLTVTPAAVAPVVTTNPTTQTVTSGATVTFTAAATGTPTPTVQWQVSVSGGAFTNVSGATSTTLSFATTSSQSGNKYQAVFTNSAGSATTSAATLTVNAVVKNASISGVVFNDINGNGVQNTGEADLSGWTVEALQNGTVVATATSTSTGYKISGLGVGTYTIAEVLKSGYVQTTPASTYTVNITSSSQSVTGKNFGDRIYPGLFTNVAGIGSPLSGSASYSNGTYTVVGSGKDIGGTSDQFEFDYANVSGNTTLVADVTSMTNTNAWAKAGLMIRASSASNSAFASVIVTPSHGVAFQYRLTTGGAVQTVYFGTILHTPATVKLVRSGNAFTAYVLVGSTNEQIGTSQTIAMSTSALGGLAVTSDATSARCTATFTNVTLNGKS